jgi:hypothetical protein
MSKLVYEGDVTVFWNQAVHTDREVTANRPNIIKNKNEKACTLIDVTTPADRNVVQKEAEKVKIQEFRYRDTTNVEREMYNYTSYNWNHWNSNEKLKEKAGQYTRKTFNRFTTEDSYIWNITLNTESTRKKACDNRQQR